MSRVPYLHGRRPGHSLFYLDWEVNPGKTPARMHYYEEYASDLLENISSLQLVVSQSRNKTVWKFS